jgi:Putative Ig domain
LKGAAVKKIVLASLLMLTVASVAWATCNLTWITESMPDGYVGVPYSQQLQVCCGTAPYTFTLYSGAFPPGITMSSSGLVSGTPTTSDFETPFITVTDAAGCHQTQAFTFYIN